MFLKISEFAKTFRTIVVFGVAAMLVSCSSSGSRRNNNTTSGLPFRAFVSDPVHPLQSGGGTPVLEIVDAVKDQLTPFFIALSGLSANVADAGMMALSPNHDRTLMISPRDSKLAIVDNTRESLLSAISLPGQSESFFVASDNNTAFVAIPSAPVTGQASGAVLKINTAGGTVDATIPIPGAHYVVSSPSGSQVLVFSDNVDTVVMLTPALIGVSGQPTTISPCTTAQVPACTLPATFDRPVGAVFDPSGAKAYVINCGPECSGVVAGIETVDMANTGNPANVILANTHLPAASTALLQGNQLYVAGTPVGAGGSLSVLNLAGGISSVICTPGSEVNCLVLNNIADGYHTRMEMGANGRLFIGSRGCSSVCLTIFDTVKLAIVATPDNTPNGDVTGIASIPNRNVVYVCQGTLLRVYDTTTDQLANIKPNGQPNLAGNAIDVKVVDF